MSPRSNPPACTRPKRPPPPMPAAHTPSCRADTPAAAPSRSRPAPPCHPRASPCPKCSPLAPAQTPDRPSAGPLPAKASSPPPGFLATHTPSVQTPDIPQTTGSAPAAAFRKGIARASPSQTSTASLRPPPASAPRSRRLPAHRWLGCKLDRQLRRSPARARMLRKSIQSKVWCGAMAIVRAPVTAALFAGAVFVQSDYLTYVGGYGPEIDAFRFHAGNGRLTRLGPAAESPAASFLLVHPNGRYLYAVHEEGRNNDAISAFAIDHKSGKLTLINTVPSH